MVRFLLYSPSVTKPNTRVSVVVPCLNEEGYIERLLEAVYRQDYPLNEVIVVDTGSTDRSLSILQAFRERHPEFPLRHLTRPLGTIPDALNAGVAAASGEIIVRLDAHSCPSDTYVRLSVEALIETGAGVAGGVWNIAPGATGPVARAITQAASHPLGAGDAAYRIGSGEPGRRAVDTVPFGCYRRATWEQVGGYNEKLLTNEDYEFNYRVRRGGQRVILDSGIRCAYIARSTMKELAIQYFRYGWWKAQMLKQHPRSIRLRQAIPVGFVSALILLAGAAVFSGLARWGLALLIGSYALVLGSASIRLAANQGDWSIAPILPAAFATIHFSWGVGMLTNLLTLGMWPKWSRRDRPA